MTFFLVSKSFGFFALPSNVIVLAGLVGLALMATRLRRIGRRLAVVSLLLIAIVGWSPLGNLLLLPLENRFPPWQPAGAEPAGVVVLGGAVEAEVALARGQIALNESAERMTAAAELARRYPSARVIFSGGNASLLVHGANEAAAAGRVLTALGVPPEQLILEDRSRNTVENARFSKALADPKPGERWLLVTSAYHMPRSIGVFRRAGFAVQAYPVDWRTRRGAGALIPFTSIGDGVRRTDTALREWVGLLAYRLAGRTRSLFPGPDDGR